MQEHRSHALCRQTYLVTCNLRNCNRMLHKRRPIAPFLLPESFVGYKIGTQDHSLAVFVIPRKKSFNALHGLIC